MRSWLKSPSGRNAGRGPIEYRIGDATILLPRDHRLPDYQREHRLYDRFLPVLAATLGSGDGIVIDVGANVGDTTVALAQACANHIVAVEGDPAFFDFMRDNLRRAGVDPARVTPVRALVGTGGISGTLVSNGSTAGLSEGAGGADFLSIDAIVDSLVGRSAGVALLKVDTDGYDWDVLASAEGTLGSSEPILFWENQLTTPDLKARYAALYPKLEALGYERLWIFDNFGNLLLAGTSYEALASINEYLAAEDAGKATRTFWYVDVLASTERRRGTAERAIAAYRDFIWQQAAIAR